MRLPSKFNKKLCGASATWAKADQNEQMNCRLGSFGESNHDSSGLFQRDHKGPRIGHHERIADRDDRRAKGVAPLSPRSKGGFKALRPKAIS
jgi:hypothetical protein